ncbi:hypothetical protein GBAR_LOCUS14198 [Geodia barretti]|uniref:Uncharacterized protein n=1 Tax=Geodia barretti TaxID=519541 RepID=A0AA35S910_GEOBA|nr:hypothetical protein GBAR_LOCUS14198 [Geodia barretti]
MPKNSHFSATGTSASKTTFKSSSPISREEPQSAAGSRPAQVAIATATPFFVPPYHRETLTPLRFFCIYTMTLERVDLLVQV